MGRVEALARDFARHVAERNFLSKGDTLLVAASGGLDSLVLLHLLRFAPDLPALHLIVAHFDHGMRPESSADASWVKGVARAWDLPFRGGVAETGLAGEEAAREARYEFLEAERQACGARWIVTAHQADDQAETVLFRIARGTGVAGLAGIPERRAPGILRPLLPFAREGLARYAESVGIKPRIDPSNEDPALARNVIRNEVLPRLEAAVAPGTRGALVRLSHIAESEERAWRSVLEKLRDDVIVESSASRIIVDRAAWLAYSAEVQARLLRALCSDLGVRLNEAGTRAAIAFTSAGSSGKEHWIRGPLRLQRAFDRLVLELRPERGRHDSLAIPGSGEGLGDFVVGGRSWSAAWSLKKLPAGPLVERFALAELTFPVRIRGWIPGDRVRHSYGSKKLKKVFGEERVSVDERSRVPVVVDGRGRVLWVPGVSRSSLLVPAEGERALAISLSTSETQ